MGSNPGHEQKPGPRASIRRQHRSEREAENTAQSPQLQHRQGPAHGPSHPPPHFSSLEGEPRDSRLTFLTLSSPIPGGLISGGPNTYRESSMKSENWEPRRRKKRRRAAGKLPFCRAETAKPINSVGVKAPSARLVSGHHPGSAAPAEKPFPEAAGGLAGASAGTPSSLPATPGGSARGRAAAPRGERPGRQEHPPRRPGPRGRLAACFPAPPPRPSSRQGVARGQASGWGRGAAGGGPGAKREPRGGPGAGPRPAAPCGGGGG